MMPTTLSRPHSARRLTATRIAATALTIVLAACGGGSDSSTGPAPSDPAPAGRGTLRLSNASDFDAWYVYVKPCSSGAWGRDRLGSSILDVGEAATLGLAGGCYDLRAESEPDAHKTFRQNAITIEVDKTTNVQIVAWADAQ
jgi:hypothetical protein